MGKLFIYGLQLPTLIGVYAEERLNTQIVYADVELRLSIERAAVSDQVDHTVDYALVAHGLREWAADCRFHLLEALARHLGQRVLQEFAVDEVMLRLKKLSALPEAEVVGVEIVCLR